MPRMSTSGRGFSQRAHWTLMVPRTGLEDSTASLASEGTKEPCQGPISIRARQTKSAVAPSA